MTAATNKINFSQNDETTLYAEVIVPLYLPKNYTWEIPSGLRDTVAVAVIVVILAGLFLYLFNLDKKITALEKNNSKQIIT